MNNGDGTSERSDDQLLDELRTVVNANDPVPDRLVESAKAAYVWRTIDEELAQLQFDSLDESEVLVRSGDTAVHLAFATSKAGINVEIGDDALTGQVVPPAIAVRILLQSGEQIEVPCDELGQFTIARPTSGRIRLIAVFDDGDVATEWFTL